MNDELRAIEERIWFVINQVGIPAEMIQEYYSQSTWITTYPAPYILREMKWAVYLIDHALRHDKQLFADLTERATPETIGKAWLAWAESHFAINEDSPHTAVLFGGREHIDT